MRTGIVKNEIDTVSRFLKRGLRAFVMDVAWTPNGTAEQEVVPVRPWYAFHRLALLVDQRVVEAQEKHGRNQLEFQLG